MPKIQIKICCDPLQVDAQAWDDLVLRSAGGHVFQTCEWMLSWWEVYGAQKKLFIFFAEEDGRLVGIAPLYDEGLKFEYCIPLRQLHMLADTGVSSDFLDFILVKGREEEILALMIDYIFSATPYQSLLLKDMAADSVTVSCLKKLHRGGLPLHIKKRRICPYVPLPSSMDDFLKQPDRTFKSIVRKKEVKPLFNRHTVEFVLTPAAADLEPYLDRFFELHTQRWQAEGRQGNFSDATKKLFYRRVSSALSSKGWLNLAALRIDGAIESMVYGMQFAGSFYDLQKGISSTGWKLKAGNVLLYRIFEALIGRVNNYHFLRGQESYKYGWGAVDVTTLTIHVWKGRKGKLIELLMSGSQGLKKVLKKEKK